MNWLWNTALHGLSWLVFWAACAGLVSEVRTARRRRLAEERAKESAGWFRTRRDGVWIDKRHTP